VSRRHVTARPGVIGSLNPTRPPALVISDLHMPDVDGWQFCRLLRSSAYEPFNRVPFLVVSATYAGPETESLTRDAGADAFMCAPVAAEPFLHLVERLVESLLSRQRTTICVMTTTDPDPGLAMRWVRLGASAYLRRPFQAEALIELCASVRRERALFRLQDLRLENERLTPNAQSALEETARAANGARHLLRQLLAFGRKKPCDLAADDLGVIVRAFSNQMGRTVRDNTALRVTAQTTPLPVMADVGQIEQVILNLVLNAQDAMPDGGLLTVETDSVALEREVLSFQGTRICPGEYARLSVTDTGSGIDAATQARLFEPFFSTKGEHGTGLGLASVLEIVTRHGGAVCLHSQPGVGTRFEIYLPTASPGGN
jgi:signal transduction histidine kinase